MSPHPSKGTHDKSKWRLHHNPAWWIGDLFTGLLTGVYVRGYVQKQGWLRSSCITGQPTPALVMPHKSSNSRDLCTAYGQPIHPCHHWAVSIHPVTLPQTCDKCLLSSLMSHVLPPGVMFLLGKSARHQVGMSRTCCIRQYGATETSQCCNFIIDEKRVSRILF